MLRSALFLTSGTIATCMHACMISIDDKYAPYALWPEFLNIFYFHQNHFQMFQKERKEGRGKGLREGKKDGKKEKGRWADDWMDG